MEKQKMPGQMTKQNGNMLGQQLAGLFPSKPPQKMQNSEKKQPRPSHNLPPTKLTQMGDQPGRDGVPASWVKQR